MEWDIVFTKLLDVIKMFKKRKASDALNDSIMITEITDNIVYSDNSVDCLFVVMIHNGGKALKPHTFKYRSVVGGSHNDFTMRRFRLDAHRSVLIDYEYELLISRIKKHGEVDVNVTELVPKGQLRTAADFEGIRFKRYYYLQENSESIWVAMAGTTAHNERLDTVEQRHQLTVAINKIKNIINKY